MALIEICRPRCQRRGYIAADRLPGILQCSGCGAAELIHGGVRKIRGHEDAVTDTKPKPARKPWKRVLTPRTPMPV
jgi:hypothetical protein